AFGGLILGVDGFLYGTTGTGGAGYLGSVFKISRDGLTYQVLHSFGFVADGADPVANLVQASDGSLYGTTDGATDGSTGLTLFKISPDGTGFATLATFGAYDINNPIIGIADQFPRVTVA